MFQVPSSKFKVDFGTWNLELGTWKEMPYIVSIDQSRCIGAGNCVHIAPKAFQLDEENIAYLVDPSAEKDEDLLDAVQGQPGAVVTVTLPDPPSGGCSRPDDASE